MKTAIAISALASLCAACAGQKVDLGDEGASSTITGGGRGSSAPGSPASSTTGGSGATSGGGGCGLQNVLGLGAPADNGYVNAPPDYCDDPLGTPLTTIDSITQAIVGVWVGCTGLGVEFTSDGHFAARTYAQDGAHNAQLVGADTPDGGYQGPSTVGTFVVVDASSTLGAGTFQLRVTAADGTVEVQQIEVFGPPTRIRLSGGTGGISDYVKPMTYAYQAGTCGVTPGTCYSFKSAADVLNRVTGRWALCTGVPGPLGALGLEIHSDGTWVGLTEDIDGQLVASSLPQSQGTLQVTAARASDGPLPYTLVLTGLPQAQGGRGGSEAIQPALTLSPTMLMLSAGSLNGQQDYGIYMPLP
jgi:hypothetical protein